MASQGPLGPGTASEDSSSGGARNWGSNTSKILAEDGNAALTVNTVSSGEQSYYLLGTNFGFSIPSGATINGIVVEWKIQSAFGGRGSDYKVRIVKGGTIGSTDRSVGEWPTSALTFVSYGSSSDLWGETWAYTDINSSTFGAAISVTANLGTYCVPAVDYVRITVYYTAAAAGMVHTRRGKRNYLRM